MMDEHSANIYHITEKHLFDNLKSGIIVLNKQYYQQTEVIHDHEFNELVIVKSGSALHITENATAVKSLPLSMRKAHKLHIPNLFLFLYRFFQENPYLRCRPFNSHAHVRTVQKKNGAGLSDRYGNLG